MSTQIFDNKFPIKWVGFLTINVLCACVFNEIIFCLFETLYFKCQYHINWRVELIFIAVALSCIFTASTSSAQCKYRIIDDILIIREKVLGKVLLSANIPIAYITDIKMTRDINHWAKHIVLHVGDKTYHLNAITYKRELFEALCKKLNSAKEKPANILFHKQTKQQK